jgi:hypothetical protein
MGSYGNSRLIDAHIDKARALHNHSPVLGSHYRSSRPRMLLEHQYRNTNGLDRCL